MEITTVVFSWCDCGSIFHSAKHLLVTKNTSNLESRGAIAVSYAIGDFERQKHTFGHLDDISGSIVKLEFGGEWYIESLQETLVQLSVAHGAIWIDQLSLTQDTVQLSAALQTLKKIYGTLEVVILLPNAPCPCLTTALQEIERGSTSVESEEPEQDEYLDLCDYAIPISSYNSRLWTKQEFFFARTISIQYCGPPTMPCTKPEYADRSLRTKPQASGEQESSMGRWHLNKLLNAILGDPDVSEYSPTAVPLDDVINADDVTIALRLRNLQESRNMRRMLKHPLRTNLFHSLADDIEFAKFMLGKKFEKDDSWPDTWSRFKDLSIPHAAADKKHYALAVLPSFSGYTLPMAWQSMTLPELLDDGIIQHELEIKACVHTRLPKGLFANGAGSMRWVPSLYLDPAEVNNMEDVYESLSLSRYDLNPERHGSGALCFREPRAQRVSRICRSQTYRAAFGKNDSTALVLFMRNIAKLYRDYGCFARPPHRLDVWATDVVKKNTRLESWPSTEHAKALFYYLLVCEHMPSDWIWPQLDHERLCLDYMCRFAGIHPDVAIAKGLVLMVKMDDFPCIGLLAHDQDASLADFKHHQDSENGTYHSMVDRWLTIEAAKSGLWNVLTLECCRSEVQSTNSDSLPEYQVKGIWYWSLGEDASIGADLVSSASKHDMTIV